MTLITPEGDTYTELTPAERAYLLALLSKCSTRNTLREQYGIDADWMRQSPYMPEPVFASGNWHLYDTAEVVIEYELSRKRPSNKPWTVKDIETAVWMREHDGWELSAIASALGRTVSAVEWKLKNVRREIKSRKVAA